MELFKRDKVIERLLDYLDIPRLNYHSYQSTNGIGPFDPEFFEREYAQRLENEKIAEKALLIMTDEDLWELSETPGQLGLFERQYSLFDVPPWYAAGFPSGVYEPDYEYWAKMDLWTLEEAVCLSVGVKPEKLPTLQIQSNSPYKAVRFFRDRLALVERASMAWSTAPNFVKPAVFMSWAKGKNLELPPALISTVLSDQDTPQPPMLIKVDRRQYDSAMKVILALMASNYGYRSGPVSSDTKRDITSGLSDLGLSMDVKTLNKVLQEAIGSRKGFVAEQLKREEKDI